MENNNIETIHAFGIIIKKEYTIYKQIDFDKSYWKDYFFTKNNYYINNGLKFYEFHNFCFLYIDESLTKLIVDDDDYGYTICEKKYFSKKILDEFIFKNFGYDLNKTDIHLQEYLKNIQPKWYLFSIII